MKKKLVHCLFKEYGIKNNFSKIDFIYFQNNIFSEGVSSKSFCHYSQNDSIGICKVFLLYESEYVQSYYPFFSFLYCKMDTWNHVDQVWWVHSAKNKWKKLKRYIFWYEYRILFIQQNLNCIHFYSKRRIISRINPRNLRNIIFLLWHFKTTSWLLHTATTDQIALYKVPQAGYY